MLFRFAFDILKFLKENSLLQQGKTRFGMFEDEVAELAEGDQKRLWDPVGCGW